MILYFQPGCDLYQIPGEDGNRARILLAKDITVRFIDLMSISAKMDRDLLRRGIEVEVSTIDISFTVCGKVLDEVLVLRLMHLFLRILASRPVILDDNGIDCPVRFCGGGFMFV